MALASRNREYLHRLLGRRLVLPRQDDPAAEDSMAVQALAVLAGRTQQVTGSLTARASGG